MVSGLQPCSEYEFRVQVLLQGSAPGPYSDVVQNATSTFREYCSPKKLCTVTEMNKNTDEKCLFLQVNGVSSGLVVSVKFLASEIFICVVSTQRVCRNFH